MSGNIVSLLKRVPERQLGFGSGGCARHIQLHGTWFLDEENKSKWFNGLIVIDFRSEGRNHYSVECVTYAWFSNVLVFLWIYHECSVFIFIKLRLSSSSFGTGLNIRWSQ